MRLIVCLRWSKGGAPISEANGDSLEVTVDYSYFTDPVSCEVSNSVGSTNVSTLVDVQCECGFGTVMQPPRDSPAVTRRPCRFPSVGPRLLSEPKPMTVDMGMDAAFTCAWTGNPPLTLAWTKQGSIVVRHRYAAALSLCVIFLLGGGFFQLANESLRKETGSPFDQQPLVNVARNLYIKFTAPEARRHAAELSTANQVVGTKDAGI